MKADGKTENSRKPRGWLTEKREGGCEEMNAGRKRDRERESERESERGREREDEKEGDREKERKKEKEKKLD